MRIVRACAAASAGIRSRVAPLSNDHGLLDFESFLDLSSPYFNTYICKQEHNTTHILDQTNSCPTSSALKSGSLGTRQRKEAPACRSVDSANQAAPLSFNAFPLHTISFEIFSMQLHGGVQTIHSSGVLSVCLGESLLAVFPVLRNRGIMHVSATCSGCNGDKFGSRDLMRC